MMSGFDQFGLSKQLHYAIEELGFVEPTPVQAASFAVVRSGKDVVAIAQTGTGKTFAYMLPILHDLKFSKQVNPRVLILVPTRELVVQVVENIESYAQYISVRVLGVYGGTNINTQKQYVAQGCDILVATPGRLRDLALSGVLQLKAIKKLVIDEVDVMMDLGFRHQLADIFDMLPERRQNIMFSATMTLEVDALIDDFFIQPEKISIAVSGTPLNNIAQNSYAVPNFYTKVNLLKHLIKKKEEFKKVLVFVASKRHADRLYEALEPRFGNELGIVHSNKSQNYRLRMVEQFDSGHNRVLIATDVMARGLDLHQISHVINFDTPVFPENYMHRIGRTGRAEQEGNALLFFTAEEAAAKEGIERLMEYQIPTHQLPEGVEVSKQLTVEEDPGVDREGSSVRPAKQEQRGASFHEKKEKNKKENSGSAHKRKMAAKYKKPKTRGAKRNKKR